MASLQAGSRDFALPAKAYGHREIARQDDWLQAGLGDGAAEDGVKMVAERAGRFG
jgi:hypothetical protein